MFGHGLAAGGLITKRKESESAALLLLLVVHDHDLDHFTEATEELTEVSFCRASRKAAQKYLWYEGIFKIELKVLEITQSSLTLFIELFAHMAIETVFTFDKVVKFKSQKVQG